MKSFLELQKEGKIKPIIKNPYGFKIPKTDLEILVEMCRESSIIKRVEDFNGTTSDSYLTSVFRELKYNGKDNSKPLVVDEEKFNKLFSVNSMFRATFNDQCDINELLSSKMIFSNGANGSGVYFCENDPKYSLDHLFKNDGSAVKGHVYKVALNANAKLIDKVALCNMRSEIIASINHGEYADGEKINFKCNPETLINLLQSDISLIALIFGVSAVYVPFRNCTSQGMFGHYVLLDKNAMAVTKDTSGLDAKVDFKNLSVNPTEEIQKIKTTLKLR